MIYLFQTGSNPMPSHIEYSRADIQWVNVHYHNYLIYLSFNKLSSKSSIIITSTYVYATYMYMYIVHNLSIFKLNWVLA